MAEVRDLLIEIGTEELPPKALRRLSSAFADSFAKLLGDSELAFEELKRFATPRRLALLVRELAVVQPDREQERRGPAEKAAFDEQGNPTRAAEGFARSCGVAVRDLEMRDTPKGRWLFHRSRQQGRATAELIPDLVEKALAALPIPKRMRWGDREDEFVRPVHWIVLLFGEEIVQGSVLGVSAGRQTRGHRFHHPQALEISRPAEYDPLLHAPGRVIPGFEERRAAVRQQVEHAATASGARALIDEELLDEVTSLVEFPVAILGVFEERFLEIPAEALIKTMQGHQKYFPVVDAEGQLLPRFIAVSNILSRDPDQVRAGNERVIRPRFSDADFFWHQDLKRPLGDRLAELKGVVFQTRLGSLSDKTERVDRLVRFLAEMLGQDPNLASRAAILAKCDLVTEMVREFPELQGTMGRHYAHRGGEPADVSVAVEEQYLPRQAGDQLPASSIGQTLAIADRVDTLVGIFAIGQAPTGVKDPFGLRRAALGVLRILIETPLAIDLEVLLGFGSEGLADRLDASAAVSEVFDYMMERLRAYYRDQGVAPQVFDAVHARRPTQPSDFDRRIRAVTTFSELPEAQALASANKRIRNILRQAGEVQAAFDPEGLSDAAERRLAEQLIALRAEVEPMLAEADYAGGLTRLAELRPAVDGFFDQVLVMCDDERLRANRLGLLASLDSLFLRVADISRLHLQ